MFLDGGTADKKVKNNIYVWNAEEEKFEDHGLIASGLIKATEYRGFGYISGAIVMENCRHYV